MIYRKSIYENTISMPISHFKYWITINAANVIYAWIIEYSTLFTMLQLWGKFRTFADAMEKKSLKGSEHELRTRICMRPNWLKRITKHRSHNYSYIRVGAKMFIFSIQSFKKCFASSEYCPPSDSVATCRRRHRFFGNYHIVFACVLSCKAVSQTLGFIVVSLYRG